MEQLTDYYSVLGVDVNAPDEVIKKQFKHLALQYHPDVYKGEDAEKRMREILLAYHTLIDPESRRTYDLSRSKHVPGSSVRAENTTDVSPAARHDRQRYFAFPPLNDDVPAQIDLGQITYLLSPSEVRRLKEQGMLRGSRRFVQIVRCEIGASTCSCAASTAMQSSKASKFVTRLVRCNMVTAPSARPTNCFPCVPIVVKLSGVPPRKNACGTCETGPRE